MTTLKKFGVAGVVMLATASFAQAQVVTYHPSSEPWTAAVEGNYQMETFDDAVLHTDILSILGDVTYPADPTAFFAGSPPVLHGVVDAETNQTVTFNFARPMIGFGANWDLFHPGGPGSQITLTLLGGASYTIENWLANTDDGAFSGIVSTIPFTQIVLSEGTNPIGFREQFEMDNLKFAAAVPEPETYAMLLAGLGLMAFVARRRRRDLAAA